MTIRVRPILYGTPCIEISHVVRNALKFCVIHSVILTTVSSTILSSTSAGLVECAFPGHYGDGYCHDENISEYCDDGGDCVGCASPENYGDGYCHDENNNEYCDDGGDCCGGSVLTFWCTLCECLHSGCLLPHFVG